ncbi:hypothetical protein [Desulfolithobacter sp.]
MAIKKKSNPAITALNSYLRRPDLSILGDAITSLPVSQWHERMFFAGAPDKELRNYTDDVFPATMRRDRTTHPVFVLQCTQTGHLVCPCSSRGHRGRQRYIRCGCILEISGRTTEQDSFLVEDCTFTMPLDYRFSRKLQFLGRVPESCISGYTDR